MHKQLNSQGGESLLTSQQALRWSRKFTYFMEVKVHHCVYKRLPLFRKPHESYSHSQALFYDPL